MLVDPGRLLGIHLRLIPRWHFATLAVERCCPGQSLGTRLATAECDSGFRSGERVIAAMLDPLARLSDTVCHIHGIVVATQVFLRKGIVHPVQITAGALRHDADQTSLTAAPQATFEDACNLTKIVS